MPAGPSDLIANPTAHAFIRAHEQDDPYALSLSGQSTGELPVSLLARQIESRQKARFKLPEWYANDFIVFPNPENLQQSSSEATAKYKARISGSGTLVDLTGGTGVDAFYLSGGQLIHFVDPNQELCSLAEHNLHALGAEIQVHATTAEAFIPHIPSGSRIFIDPSRRDDNRQKVVSLRDCTPDITALLPDLLSKSNDILLKASPMVDIQSAISELDHHVSEVHVVEWRGECREVLFKLTGERISDPFIYAVSLDRDQKFTFTHSEEQSAESDLGPLGEWLYEPSPAFMKAGPFKSLSAVFNLRKLHMNTHLYSSDKPVADFPGRMFRVVDSAPFSIKQMKQMCPGRKANITTRNFPESVASLRKKSGIKDGGDDYLFLFSGPSNQLQVCRCRRP